MFRTAMSLEEGYEDEVVQNAPDRQTHRQTQINRDTKESAGPGSTVGQLVSSAQPRWELGWPSSPRHTPGPRPPLSSHRPASTPIVLSHMKPVSGSQDLLPMFSCPGDSIVPSARDAVTR